MTTSNENIYIPDVEKINEEPRPIAVLQRLGTYQGMTDEEIESLIKWRESNAYARGNSDAVSSQGMINVMESKRRNDVLRGRIADMVESLERQSAELVGR